MISLNELLGEIFTGEEIENKDNFIGKKIFWSTSKNGGRVELIELFSIYWITTLKWNCKLVDWPKNPKVHISFVYPKNGNCDK